MYDRRSPAEGWKRSNSHADSKSCDFAGGRVMIHSAEHITAGSYVRSRSFVQFEVRLAKIGLLPSSTSAPRSGSST
jgi:hypothetical protein